MTGILQGCLLVMGITFELRARRKKMAGDGDGNGDGNGHAHGANGNTHGHVTGEEDHERTVLLGSER